jgi:hypothetical protein
MNTTSVLKGVFFLPKPSLRKFKVYNKKHPFNIFKGGLKFKYIKNLHMIVYVQLKAKRSVEIPNSAEACYEKKTLWLIVSNNNDFYINIKFVTGTFLTFQFN